MGLSPNSTCPLIIGQLVQWLFLNSIHVESDLKDFDSQMTHWVISTTEVVYTLMTWGDTTIIHPKHGGRFWETHH